MAALSGVSKIRLKRGLRNGSSVVIERTFATPLDVRKCLGERADATAVESRVALRIFRTHDDLGTTREAPLQFGGSLELGIVGGEEEVAFYLGREIHPRPDRGESGCRYGDRGPGGAAVRPDSTEHQSRRPVRAVT